MDGTIDHIEIEVSDAEEMVGFLKNLGFETHRETEHHGKSYELKPPNAEQPLFEIHTVQEDESPGINHIAFEADNLDSLADDLRAKGVDQVEDPYYVEPTGRTILNFRDPDGRRFQVVSSDE